MELIIFIVIIFLIAGITLILGKTNYRQAVYKFTDYFSRRSAKKQQNKEKILAFLKERGQAGNEELRKHVSVSARTIVRYMDEIEKEGNARQIGNTGKWSHYKSQ
ncbi:MAG: HTH domain-containing protein [Patescibacteria group bacterium]